MVEDHCNSLLYLIDHKLRLNSSKMRLTCQNLFQFSSVAQSCPALCDPMKPPLLTVNKGIQRFRISDVILDVIFFPYCFYSITVQGLSLAP